MSHVSRRYVSGYDPSQIRAVPFPQGEDYGDGWWRVAWEVQTEPRALSRDLRLPPPPRGIDDVAIVVAVWPREAGRITVEALGRHEKLIGEEVAYISLVMQEIRAHYRGITIDGHVDHPILHMAGA